MCTNVKDASEVVKNTTEATKNVAEIVQMILQPRGIDAAIQEGHKKMVLVNKYVGLISLQYYQTIIAYIIDTMPIATVSNIAQ